MYDIAKHIARNIINVVVPKFNYVFLFINRFNFFLVINYFIFVKL